MTSIVSRFRIAAILAAATLATAASAATVSWTDWTSLTNGQRTAQGTMAGVGVTVTAGSPMNGVSQLTGPGAGCLNYWTQPNPADRAYTDGTVSNAPTACEQIGLNSANRLTATFSAPVEGLYLALLSVGQPGLAVTYDFDQSFTIDSEGAGYWGNDATNGVIGAGDTLTMREFHGVLRFSGPVTSLTWTTTAENWQAFTFGTVPTPGTLALLGAGLLAAAAVRRRRA